MQLAEQEQLFVFLQLVRSAGLEDAFENFGEYTVFAPSESAMYGKCLELSCTCDGHDVYSTSMMRSEWVSVDPFSSIKN
jgi:hypothetical protein